MKAPADAADCRNGGQKWPNEKTLMEMSARASAAAVSRITADVGATAVAKVASMRDSLSGGTGLGRNPTGSTRGAPNPQTSHMRSELPPNRGQKVVEEDPAVEVGSRLVPRPPARPPARPHGQTAVLEFDGATFRLGPICRF